MKFFGKNYQNLIFFKITILIYKITIKMSRCKLCMKGCCSDCIQTCKCKNCKTIKEDPNAYVFVFTLIALFLLFSGMLTGVMTASAYVAKSDKDNLLIATIVLCSIGGVFAISALILKISVCVQNCFDKYAPKKQNEENRECQISV